MKIYNTENVYAGCINVLAICSTQDRWIHLVLLMTSSTKKQFYMLDSVGLSQHLLNITHISL